VYAEKTVDVNKGTAGRNPPKEIHAFIEIPFGGVPVKYELDKGSGALYVDRFLHTAMFYPWELWIHWDRTSQQSGTK
jgi:inorganic pyrophosphatase